MLLLLLVGGFIVWFIVRASGENRALAEAERRRALSMFEIDRSDAQFGDQTRFDFQAMRAHHRWDVMGEPGCAGIRRTPFVAATAAGSGS